MIDQELLKSEPKIRRRIIAYYRQLGSRGLNGRAIVDENYVMHIGRGNNRVRVLVAFRDNKITHLQHFGGSGSLDLDERFPLGSKRVMRILGVESKDVHA